jgi:gliding motility-associated-like protein
MKRIFKFLKFNIFLLISYTAAAQIDTQFWFAPPDITESHGDIPINLVITAFDKEANITITQPANSTFVPIQFSVQAFSSFSYDFSSIKSVIETSGVNVTKNTGLFISSTNLISVNYTINNFQNPETFSLKGSNALGNEFVITSQKHLINRISDGYNAAYIVASEDNTTLTITPSVELYGHKKGVTFNVSLNKGQVYVAAASLVYQSFGSQIGGTPIELGNQIGGTKVIADKPVSITMSDDSAGFRNNVCFDLSGDQILPTCLASVEFITLPGSLNVSVSGQAVTDIIYIYPTKDNTTLKVNGTTVLGTKNIGEYFFLLNNGAINKFVSDKPVLVYQLSGNGCEVGGAVIPDILRSGLNFSSVNRITSEKFIVNIISKVEHIDQFEINGLSKSINLNWEIIDNIWGVCRLDLSDINLLEIGETVYFNNSSGKFNMGLIHGGEFSGTRYAYFSNFSISLDEPFIEVDCKDKSAVFSMKDNTGDSGIFQISYDNGMSWVEVTKSMKDFVVSDFPKVELSISRNAFFDGLLVRFVEQNESCSINSFPSRLEVDCPEGIPLFIPNVITPNGDRKNDQLLISGLNGFDSNELIIFNRYGDHVYQKKDYQNDWSGEGLLSGTYFYILSVVDFGGNPKQFKGWIQIIRE